MDMKKEQIIKDELLSPALPLAIAKAPWPAMRGDTLAEVHRCPYCEHPVWWHCSYGMATDLRIEINEANKIPT